MILSLAVVSLFGCKVYRGHEQRIRDVYNGRIAIFLGLQIKQAKEETFMHQAEYMKDILKKFKWMTKPLSTPMSETATLDGDED
jgi:hypothetical protein